MIVVKRYLTQILSFILAFRILFRERRGEPLDARRATEPPAQRP
jgi:hypothetical protein